MSKIASPRTTPSASRMARTKVLIGSLLWRRARRCSDRGLPSWWSGRAFSGAARTPALRTRFSPPSRGLVVFRELAGKDRIDSIFGEVESAAQRRVAHVELRQFGARDANIVRRGANGYGVAFESEAAFGV